MSCNVPRRARAAAALCASTADDDTGAPTRRRHACWTDVSSCRSRVQARTCTAVAGARHWKSAQACSRRNAHRPRYLPRAGCLLTWVRSSSERAARSPTWGAETSRRKSARRQTREAGGAFTSPYRLAPGPVPVHTVAAGAQPIDTEFIDFRDHDGLSTRRPWRRDGFTGKLAIHPIRWRSTTRLHAEPPEDRRAQDIVAMFAASPEAGASRERKITTTPPDRPSAVWRVRACEQMNSIACSVKASRAT